MGNKLSHDDFKIEVLSTKGMAMVSEFALLLYRQSGVLIDVEAPDAVTRVFFYAESTRDKRLRSIYLHLKTEFCIRLLHKRVSPDVGFSPDISRPFDNDAYEEFSIQA